MRTKRGKRKPAPAIVPRFLKGAVTIGAIPAIAAACGNSQSRMQPVVAYMAAPPARSDDASTTPDPPPPPPPVVAAFQREAEPVAPPIDAGVDAAPAKKAKPDKTTTDKPKTDKLKRPPPPVVAALIPRDKQ